MSYKQLNRGRRRSGAILFVVVACLALFLSVGIAFVFYANQQAISMRFQREASFGGHVNYLDANQMTRGATDEAPPVATDLFNMALGQLIYGVADTASGPSVYSALYGHDLARGIYGWNGNSSANIYPYNGFGRTSAAGTTLNYAGTWVGGSTGMRPEWESGSYIAKNAPYTYPDENNCYLAAVRASDGRVLVPSFHRPWLFNGVPGNATSPWTQSSPTLLRAALPTAPYANSVFSASDPSYGDVENLEGKSVHQYDSMWLDLDAPVRYWRGRLYKPLFAFLVVDLDGRINVNVAGNNRGPGQSSNQGWGPWEMNPNYVLDASNFTTGQGTRALVGSAALPKVQRYTASSQPTQIYSLNGTTGQAMPLGTLPASYAPPDYDGSGATPLVYPLTTQYTTYPTFSGGYATTFAQTQAELTGHPSLYNPYFAVSTKAPKPTWTYDQRFDWAESFFFNKENSDPSYYAKSDLGSLATTSLLSTSATTPNYRMLFTPTSNDLQRPGMRPWRTSADPAGASNLYQQASATVLPTGGPILSPTVPSNPAGAASEYDANWRSVLAYTLGSIDLNRKLTDYRGDPTQSFEALVSPNSPYAAMANGGVPNGSINYAQALLDRQRLAKDIFTRLAATTGAMLPTESLPAAGTPQYYAVQRLAQIAVNIVDYIDNDDYITWFPWNPVDAANLSDPANITAQQIQNGAVVFGTELPRLVINEVYSNWDNNPNDPILPPANVNGGKPYAAQPYQLGTWVELYNPLTPQGGTDPNLSHGGGAPLVYNNNPVYQLLISTDPAIQTQLVSGSSGNSDGHPSVAPTPAGQAFQAGQIQTVTISPLATVTNPTYPQVTVNGQIEYGVLPPSSQPYAGGPPVGTNWPGANQGFYIVGPQNVADQKTPPPLPVVAPQLPATVPGTNANPAQNIPVSYQTQQMMWTVPNTSNTLPANYAPTAVLLQRLLCPHLPQSAINPFITVDYVLVNSSQVYDHRQYVSMGQLNQSLNTVANGYTQYSAQASYGRNQPYAGAPAFYASQGTTAPVTATAPPATAAAGSTDTTLLNQTFYQQNTSSTPKYNLNGVFDWLVQLDRPLISPPELFCASAYPPYQLTQQFVTGTLAAPVKQQHLANWNVNYSVSANATTASTSVANADNMLLYRSLGLLDVRGRTQGLGFGGRVPGRVNINTIFDVPLGQTSPLPTWNAICDPSSTSNLFTSSNPNVVTTSWTAIQNARKVITGNTAWTYTSKPLADTPFMPPSDNYTSAGDAQFPNGQDITQTILGISAMANNPGQTHPYLQNELLTKIYNNITTRSNSFAVYCTIGYFEVTNAGPFSATNRPALGKEIGSDDGNPVRHKFFAIVDRTKLTLSSTTAGQQGPSPVFLSYEPQPQSGSTNLILPDPVTNGGNAVNVTINVPATSVNTVANGISGIYDGQSWTLSAGRTVYIDVGANQESATVTAVAYTGAGLGGTVTLQLSGKIAHSRGCIIQFDPATPTTINQPPAQLGNPGPQPQFNFKDRRYLPVVPFATRYN